MKKPRCHNCQHSSDAFKVGKLTQHHCFDKRQYPVSELITGNRSPWETLRVFSDTCDNHEFKELKQKEE